jgi:predicted nucleotidyltransferase
MMSSYKVNYEHLRLTPDISEMLLALERGLGKFGIDYYLVGAVARDVWMSGINNIAPKRTTGDIDFAVLINDKGIYEALKEYLIRYESFHPSKENAFVLMWKDKTQVDLLPFGGIEDDDAKVTIQGLDLQPSMFQALLKYMKRDYPKFRSRNSIRSNFAHCLVL